MSEWNPRWNNPRGIIERIFIRGALTLDTPACFGSGDAEGTTDIPLLRDSLDPARPLLTGASIAGALRNFLREAEQGYGWDEDRRAKHKSVAEHLFGHLDDSKEDERAAVESWLMIDDAIGRLPAKYPIEIRDGVAIDPRRRVAETDSKTGRGAKYDVELLAAGTRFELSLEFWRMEGNQNMLDALVCALQGLEDGKISLGLRKKRGYGRCHAGEWRVWRYRMNSIDGLMGWLNHTGEGGECGNRIADCFRDACEFKDNRRHLRIEAEFELDGSLLIRADVGGVADMVHLRSARDGQLKPILSGTSLAGVVRARALRIASTIHGPDAARAFIDDMFGRRRTGQDSPPTGSLVSFDEVVIENDPVVDLVQSRVKIDRFTGGAYPQALFNQQPAFSAPGRPATLKIGITLRRLYDDKVDDYEARAGLLLLVLKDLWTGDLPLGGESSVGRGRLRGVRMTVEDPQIKGSVERRQDGALHIAGQDSLESCVARFRDWKPFDQHAAQEEAG